LIVKFEPATAARSDAWLRFDNEEQGRNGSISGRDDGISQIVQPKALEYDIKSKPVKVVHLSMCRVFVSTNGHPLDKTVRDANLFCWFRHLERVSFFIPQKARFNG